jgi:predicted AAA+ superfamily ATPase
MSKKIPDIVHKELLALHELYLQIGGMPGLINEYLNLSTVVNVSEQHSFLISSYHDYILKNNPDSDALKMNQVFDSLILQLIKENKKFQYKLIRKGTTHFMYKDAIQKLTENNYVIKCNRISNEQLNNPIETFSSEEWSSIDTNTNFKLYLPDIGMLYTKMVEEYGTSFETNHKKALLENYIAQSLQAKNYPFAFWESDSMAKIDFIILKDREVIPIEVHESDNTRSKSISILKQKCDFPYAIKVSSKNFEFTNQTKYVPYYAVFCL